VSSAENTWNITGYGSAKNKQQYARERKIYKETGKIPWEVEK
jgi:hypothetical protein